MEKRHILRRFLLKATYRLDLLLERFYTSLVSTRVAMTMMLLYQDMEARLLPVKESELQASIKPIYLLWVKIARFKLSLDFPLFKVAGPWTLKWQHNING